MLELAAMITIQLFYASSSYKVAFYLFNLGDVVAGICRFLIVKCTHDMSMTLCAYVLFYTSITAHIMAGNPPCAQVV